MARSTLFSFGDVLAAAVFLFSALATTACGNNPCLPGTTCVSGPNYGETFNASVVPASDAAANDADAAVDASALDAGESGEADAIEAFDASPEE